MTLKQACEILNVETPYVKISALSRMEKDIFFDDVKEKYLQLIKLNHPDKGGEHDNSVQIIEAFQFLRDQVNNKHTISITEWFEKQAIKKQEKKENSNNIKQKKTYLPIYQYDFKLNLIKIWECSPYKIGKELNLGGDEIVRALKKEYKQYKGFIWSNVMLEKTDENISNFVPKITKYNKYDENNNLIKSYCGIKGLKSDDYLREGVYHSINNNVKYKGFFWKKENCSAE
jgi:hypothetical protein